MDDKKEDLMLKFIDLVLGEVGEYSIFDNESSSKGYFLHGGCYELYKIIVHYFPNVQMVMRKDYKHCAISYNDNYYDANGIIEDKDNFIPATKDDYLINEEVFGLKIKVLSATSIIKNIDDNVNLKGVLY